MQEHFSGYRNGEQCYKCDRFGATFVGNSEVVETADTEPSTCLELLSLNILTVMHTTPLLHNVLNAAQHPTRLFTWTFPAATPEVFPATISCDHASGRGKWAYSWRWLCVWGRPTACYPLAHWQTSYWPILSAVPRSWEWSLGFGFFGLRWGQIGIADIWSFPRYINMQ